jgi:hypothetical protein
MKFQSFGSPETGARHRSLGMRHIKVTVGEKDMLGA